MYRILQQKMIKNFYIGWVLVLSLFFSTASVAAELEMKDPYEGMNRIIFDFNDRVDTLITKPIATLYNAILPKPLNLGINNFFNNITLLPTIANDVLQLHFYQATNDIWRVFINTTVGIGGLFDIATRIQLKMYTNDFGLTLARWGYMNSNYLVVPFFGPNTIRDTIGLPIDYFAFSIYPRIYPAFDRYALYSLGVIDKRAQLLKVQPVFDEVMFDKYDFIRNAYSQRRAFQLEQNQQQHFLYNDNEDNNLSSGMDTAPLQS